eukprot:755033-Hanusia_phi.AAC.2
MADLKLTSSAIALSRCLAGTTHVSTDPAPRTSHSSSRWSSPTETPRTSSSSHLQMFPAGNTQPSQPQTGKANELAPTLH